MSDILVVKLFGKEKTPAVARGEEARSGMTAKCMKCGKVFDIEGAVLQPIGDGGYLECCPKCGSTNVYYMDYFPSEEKNWWQDY